MTHARLDASHTGGSSGSGGATGRHAGPAEPSTPIDPRHPGEEFLMQEIANDRKGEWALIGKTLIALAIAAVLVVVRQVFFV